MYQYPYSHQNGQFTNINPAYQQPVEMKTCQRARGPHTEGEIYCGRTLPINYFSKGRSQCKECSAKKTKAYNETKIATSSPAVVINHEMEESLKKLSLELEQMKIEHKKYYDASLQYHNENLRLSKQLQEKQEEFDTVTLSNSDLVKRNQTLQSELEDKTRTIKINTDTISSLQKEIRELRSENVSLNDEIRVLGRKR